MTDSFHENRIKIAMQRDEELKYMRNFWIKFFLNSKFRMQSHLSLYAHIKLNMYVSENLDLIWQRGMKSRVAF